MVILKKKLMENKNALDILLKPLTLPVRRYLVPTPSTKGGGGGGGEEEVEPTPTMISETADSTNFNFGRQSGLSMKGKKPVELMI